MKIYTQHKITEIKNQCLNKIYNALQELRARDDKQKEGVVNERHEEILDIALKHLYSEPTEDVYGLAKKESLEGSLLKS